jgi:hypothetical protein
MKTKRVLIFGLLSAFIFTTLIFFQERSSAAPQENSYVYLPLVFGKTVDFAITGVEITQGVQSMNNNVVMVANRPTAIRVYAKMAQGNATNSSVTVSATRNSTSIGSITIGPGTVPLTTSRANYSTTFNAILPSSWLSGNVVITAKVDPTNQIPESSETNNTVSYTVNFKSVPDLIVTVVPIDYTHQGSFQPGYYPGNRVDYISDWIMRTFPVDSVNLSIRGSNYDFSGDLSTGSDWGTLLVNIATLKQMDLGSVYVPTLYYGFIPISNATQQWFYSGIAGLGYVGGGIRTSIGLNFGNNDSTGSLAAHEIGHNLNRPHSPCGGASSPDPNYPYAGASIGEYGLDGIAAGSPSVINPNSYTDVMGYCDPVWISDYTYKKLYDDQLANGYMVTTAVPTNSLLVQGVVDENGQVTITTVYAFNQLPLMPEAEGQYSIDLVGADGATIGSYPAIVAMAEEPGITVRTLMAVIPLPVEMVAEVRVMAGETAVTTHSLQSAVTNMDNGVTVAQEASTIVLHWGQPEMPAAVRYTTNDGATYTTLALNVLGGEFEVVETELPEGENGRFEIILANTAQPVVLTTTLK